MSIKSLLVKGNHPLESCEKIADALLFFPRLFMGRSVRCVMRDKSVILGRKVEADGTRYKAAKHQKPPSRLMEYTGSLETASLIILVFGSIGALIVATTAVAAAVFASIAILSASAPAAVGLALKKISVERNPRSKMHQVMIDRFFVWEANYRHEKMLMKSFKNGKVSHQKEIESLAMQEPELRTSLHAAVRGCMPEVQDIDLPKFPTGLHILLQSNSFEAAKQLIGNPLCDLNAKGKRGSTPLHEAVRSGNLEIVQLLLKHGALVNVRDFSGRTPLQLAVEVGASMIVDSLLGIEGIDVVDQKQTPLLFSAIKLGQEKCLKQLLTHSPRYLETRNELGMTPFLYAVWLGNTEIARLLVDFQSNILAAAEEGNSPLHLAASSRSREMLSQIAAWLKEKKCLDLLARNKDGKTPLHLAVRTGSIEMIKGLLELGADPDAVDNSGKRPVDYLLNASHSHPISDQILNLLKTPVTR